LLYRMASSTYFNMSILTSDFWGLCFGKFRSPMELAAVVLTRSTHRVGSLCKDLQPWSILS